MILLAFVVHSLISSSIFSFFSYPSSCCLLVTLPYRFHLDISSHSCHVVFFLALATLYFGPIVSFRSPLPIVSSFYSSAVASSLYRPLFPLNNCHLVGVRSSSCDFLLGIFMRYLFTVPCAYPLSKMSQSQVCTNCCVNRSINLFWTWTATNQANPYVSMNHFA